MKRAAALAAACSVLLALVVPGAAQAASCGVWGALFPAKCQPAPAPVAPDPGGSETPDQPIPPPGKEFGFNAALYLGGQATVEQELDAAAAAGATVQRVPVTWRDVQVYSSWDPVPEPTPTNFVTMIETFYDAALARGITPVFITYWAPLWASKYRQCFILDSGCKSIRQSNHKVVPDTMYLDEYAAFVEAVKRRWPRALIEPWNEPDLYWGDPNYGGSRAFPATPEYFKEMQCAAYQASKSVNDDPVLAAGWAGNNNAEYLRRVLAAGGADCWDIANMHVYPNDETDFGEGSQVAIVFDRMRKLRAEYGDTDPFWVTETGYSTTGDRRVTLEAQADGSRRLYNRLMTMPDVDAVFFNTLRDSSFDLPPYNDPSRWEYGFGFMYEDWQPKPVYCEFAARAGNQPPGC